VRFAGDSGDGIQLIGAQFAFASARAHNDVRTLPDFPSEIRAPEGTMGGVSSFQLRFGTNVVYSSGDTCDVLVAMNAAALRVCLRDVRRGGTIIANTQGFSEDYLQLAGYATNPLTDGSLKSYNVVPVDMARLAALAVQADNRSEIRRTESVQREVEKKLSTKELSRTKNFFALGITYWLFSRPIERTKAWIDEKFAATPQLAEANKRALQAGWSYADSAEALAERYVVEPSDLPAGHYRSLTGNAAAALGLMAASLKAQLPLFFGGYPITPASDILQTLVQHKRFGVQVFQAEDEIAAIASALGASFGGHLAATATSGPGMSLKAEALGLAVMAELPLVVIDVQRAGPSTGMPTKTEQTDLYQALYGRHGEAPLPVLAAQSPADCFQTCYEAARIAITYRVPVVVLSDALLANGSELWRIPKSEELLAIDARFATSASSYDSSSCEPFAPFARDKSTFARNWAIPGTRGLEHRLGGLEKQDGTGAVSQDADNHARMVSLRAAKLKALAAELPPVEVFGAQKGQVLVIGWGGTFGALREAVQALQREGERVSHLHVRNIKPLPPNLETLLQGFDRIVVAELNSGQFAHYLRAELCADVVQYNSITGQPFKADDVTTFVRSLIKQEHDAAQQEGAREVLFCQAYAELAQHH
jgi:2-oxoglutarate ferredoxin oxidoreductase subunit alpha